MRIIHILDHLNTPEPDALRGHLAARGLTLDARRMDRGDGAPVFGPQSAGLILTGGAQMITDRDALPFMAAEMAIAAQARDIGLPVLGICLGAQMLAHMLGGVVGPHADGQVALGFYETVATAAGAGLLPDRLMTLAGNEQGFSLPPGADLLATGAMFPNQAFRAGDKTLALQFHPEVTRLILDDWQEVLRPNAGKPGTQPEATQNAGFTAHDPALKAWMGAMLDRHFALG
ncbi:MAG: GMP synthase (glutamine-hydrolyzing) [Paracoccaceae bacterium]|jgi:GMP synthase (glutamine-hydrolysing)